MLVYRTATSFNYGFEVEQVGLALVNLKLSGLRQCCENTLMAIPFIEV